MSLVENERTKLLANSQDRASTSCLTVGVIGPIVAVLYDLGGAGTAVSIRGLVAGTLYWLLIAASLHLLARYVLGRLQ